MPKKYIHYATEELVSEINVLNIMLLEKFIKGMRSLRKITRESYEKDIKFFFVFILRKYNNLYIFNCTSEEMAEILERFIFFCYSEQMYSVNRVERILSAISSFYIYWRRKRKVKENPVELITRAKIVKNKDVNGQTILTLDDINKIRRKLSQSNDTQLKLVFEMCIVSFARLNELSQIKIYDINLDDMIVRYIDSETGNLIVLVFDTKCRDLIKQWLLERYEMGIRSPLLFCTKSGNNLKCTISGSMMRTIGGYVDKTQLTIEDVRQSGALLLRDNKWMPPKYIARLLHHKIMGVPEDFYTQDDVEKFLKEIRKYIH